MNEDLMFGVAVAAFLAVLFGLYWSKRFWDFREKVDTYIPKR